MPILSNELLFSDDQAITADAASTNYSDLGAPGTPFGAAAALNQDVGKGEPVNILLRVTEAFNNLTSLKIGIEVDDNTSFSSATEVLSQTLLLAALTLGARWNIQWLPQGVNERYVRLYYDVTGTAPSTGKIKAGISGGDTTNLPN